MTLSQTTRILRSTAIFFLGIFIFVVTETPCPAIDAIPIKKNLLQLLEARGIDIKQTGQNINVYTDQIKALSTFDTTGTAVASQDINLQPTSVTFGAISLPNTMLIIIYLYQTNPDMDQIHVTDYISAPDDYGNVTTEYCYSFNFDRNLYNKIDWANFTSGHIPLVAPNFTFSDWCIDKMNYEKKCLKASKLSLRNFLKPGRELVV